MKSKTNQKLERERETDIVEESRMDWEQRSEQFGPHPPPSPSKRRRRHRSNPSLSLSLSLSKFVCFCNWLLKYRHGLGLFISVSELPPVLIRDCLKCCVTVSWTRHMGLQLGNFNFFFFFFFNPLIWSNSIYSFKPNLWPVW